MNRFRLGAPLVLALLSAPAALAQTSYTNATAITITDCPNPCPASGQAASLYPSPVVVSGQVGVVQRVSVTINGFSHAFPADVDFLLVAPSGRASVLMSDFGAGSPGVSNIDLTLDDYADRPVTSTVRQHRRAVRDRLVSSGELRHDRPVPGAGPRGPVHLHAVGLQRR